MGLGSIEHEILSTIEDHEIICGHINAMARSMLATVVTLPTAPHSRAEGLDRRV